MRRILYGLGNILLTVLIILLVCYGWAFVEMKIMLRPFPRLFGYTFYMMDDDSMAPELRKNDIAIISDDTKYGVGDKILFLSSDGQYLLHTVVSADTIGTTTKCNTCTNNDKPIDSSQVMGRAVAKIAYLGVLINFFKNKGVLLCIALFGILCLILSRAFKYKPKVEKVPQRN